VGLDTRPVSDNRSAVRHAIALLTLVFLMPGHWPRVTTAAQDLDDPDRLYEQREDPAKSLAAAAIWERRLAARADDFESAWKLARACYWLGGHVAPADRRKQFDRGIEAARGAVSIHPQQPEGHFWLAANMGGMAEAAGIRGGLKYRGDIKRELETVLALDASFQKGSADRALGRWYFKVPKLFGGNRQKSLEHLRRALAYDPNDAASLSFLADTLLDLDRREEARQTLEKLVTVPIDPEWAPESREFQRQAAATLARLREKT
jgi:tetratricopeptide (TPR) repeat protein